MFSTPKEAVARLAEILTHHNQGNCSAEEWVGLVRATDIDAVVSLTRKMGLLRCSRHDYKEIPLTVISVVLRELLNFCLSDRNRIYLSSVGALLTLAPAVRKKLKKVRDSINPRSFKTYLVTADRLFREQHNQKNFPHRKSWTDFTKEELADALSYYFVLLQEKSPPTLQDLNHVIVDKAGTDYYLRQLAELARIIRFREAEIQIDSLPYFAVADGDSIIIGAIDDSFEKATRWGYIRAEQQRDADRLHLQFPDAPSIESMAEAIVKDAPEGLFEMVQGKQSRVRIKLIVAEAFCRLFKDEALYREDAATILHHLKILHLTMDQFQSVRISDSITLGHVIRFQRFWLFVTHAMQAYCRDKGILNTPIYYRSLIPVLTEADAFTMTREFCGIDRPEDLFKILSVSTYKSKMVDLLYRPVIGVEKSYVIPPALVGYCNIARNALQTTSYRFDSESSVDPLGSLMIAAFMSIGADPRANVKYQHKGVEGEIDVLVTLDDRIFAFECKNSLHPCNVAEIRQSHDHLEKGFKQLTKLRLAMADESFCALLGSKTGLALSSESPLVTCVVMGNHMFTGYEHEGHSVRSIGEIVNVIKGGEAVFLAPKSMSDPYGPKTKLSLSYRKKASSRSDDLVEYLRGNSLHRVALGAMVSHGETISFGRHKLIFRSFGLNVANFTNALREHPQVIETDDPTSVSEVLKNGIADFHTTAKCANGLMEAPGQSRVDSLIMRKHETLPT